ncbi:MAG: 50S ribosomal protein L3 [Bdellovibrionaceae bacterium]|nr:50S ribosomal protein L3 [Pseudobdellovibrionaceae bacterium]
MSETQVEPQESNEQSTSTAVDAKLEGLYAHKVGMSSVYNEEGQFVPVTVLKVGEWKVTQVKTTEKDGYSAVQVGLFGRREDKVSSAIKGHTKNAGKGAHVLREIRGEKTPEGVTVGQAVSLESLQKGDVVRLTAKSKGRGFSGAMRRWNFAGGPASHGSKFHRRPGSAGTRTWPGFVLPGKRGPGHYGDETITIRNVKVVDVNPQEGLILVKGPVPGARNGLVKIIKQLV